MAINKNLFCYQGDDLGETVTLLYANGNPINLDNASFFAQAKTSYYTPNIAATLTVNLFDAPNGNLSLSLSAANTSNMAAGKYFYDLTMVNASNLTSHVMTGQMVIGPGVTNIIPPANGSPAL